MARTSVSSGLNDPRHFCGASMRKRRNYVAEPMELPLPKFKYDKWWAGPVPDKEITFANLNDNIDSRFLEDMCARFGECVECRVYYHPRTNKHLGLAKVVFQTQRSARECCAALNHTTKMGNRMDVFLDTMGLQRSRMVEQITNPSQAAAVSLALSSGSNSKINGSLSPPPPLGMYPTSLPPAVQQQQPPPPTSSASPSSSSSSFPQLHHQNSNEQQHNSPTFIPSIVPPTGLASVLAPSGNGYSHLTKNKRKINRILSKKAHSVGLKPLKFTKLSKSTIFLH
jgi:histone-lysine N-methyltransferase SETD1